MARIAVDDSLVEQLKQKFPELQKLKPTQIADVALRKLLSGGL